MGECKGAKCPTGNFCLESGICKDTYLYGNIAWGIAAGDLNIFSNRYVDSIQIVPLCSKPDGSNIGIFGQIQAVSLGNTNMYSFHLNNLGNTLSNLANRCSTYFGQTLFGLVLKVQVNDDRSGPTWDDYYAIGKDCQAPIVDSENNIYWEKIDWSKVNNLNNSLFSLDDLSKGVKCDLNIISAAFRFQ